MKDKKVCSDPLGGSSFRELLKRSMKSADTEEWLDVHFTRPIGLAFALGWIRLGVRPNTVTVLSIILGSVAGVMFYFAGLAHTLCGIVLLMLANFCDSTDGQMARLTGQKTLTGRILDGLSENIWFVFIYLAIVFRLWHQPMPVGGHAWGIWIFLLCAVAGFYCHQRQCALADYYRQIHLYFLLGREGSELDTYASQREAYRQTPKDHWLERYFFLTYANYCRGQEAQTPAFQSFYKALRTRWADVTLMPSSLRGDFRQGSLPLMKYTNLLTFNTRAITLYLSCLLDCPWVYPLMEVTVFHLMYLHMRRRHERLCREMQAKYLAQ